MTTKPDIIAYESARPVKNELRFQVIASVIFISVQFPWYIVYATCFYFLSPTWLHYAVFDYVALRLVQFMIFSLPTVLSVMASAVVIHRSRIREVKRLDLILAAVCLALSIPSLLFFFWGAVISPPNPHGPGYWI